VRHVANRCDPARSRGTCIISAGGVMEAQTRWAMWCYCIRIVTARFTMVGGTDSRAASCERRTGMPEPYEA
jgi:hypothetical protein